MLGSVRSNRCEYVPDVVVGKPGNPTATPMLVPGSVQQWMCAAEGGPPTSPEYVTSTASVSAVVSTVIRDVPVADEPVGGTSLLPSRFAVKKMRSACAAEASRENEA